MSAGRMSVVRMSAGRMSADRCCLSLLWKKSVKCEQKCKQDRRLFMIAAPGSLS